MIVLQSSVLIGLKTGRGRRRRRRRDELTHVAEPFRCPVAVPGSDTRTLLLLSDEDQMGMAVVTDQSRTLQRVELPGERLEVDDSFLHRHARRGEVFLSQRAGRLAL